MRLHSSEAGSLVVCPGILASIVNVGLTALGVVFGIWGATQPGGLAFGLIIAILALLLILFLVGMRVEVDRSSIAKCYFFGLFCRCIPLSELTLKQDWQANANAIGGYTVQVFKGRRTSFSVIPFYVWRKRDVRAIIDRCVVNSSGVPDQVQ